MSIREREVQCGDSLFLVYKREGSALYKPFVFLYFFLFLVDYNNYLKKCKFAHPL